MITTTYSTTEASRLEVIDFIKRKKRENPNYTVVDIGGGHVGWAAEVTDCIIDQLHGDYNFDICEEKNWKEFDRTFDYAICTHTLEDIYNPFIPLKYFPKIAKAGIITMPSIRTELSRIEGYGWIGYIHHRYLFNEQDGSILITPKLPVLEAIVKNDIIFNREVEEVQFRWEDDIPYIYNWNMGYGPHAVITYLKEFIKNYI